MSTIEEKAKRCCLSVAAYKETLRENELAADDISVLSNEINDDISELSSKLMEIKKLLECVENGVDFKYTDDAELIKNAADTTLSAASVLRELLYRNNECVVEYS